MKVNCEVPKKSDRNGIVEQHHIRGAVYRGIVVWFGVMWCDMMWYGMSQCGMAWCGVLMCVAPRIWRTQ